MIEKIQKFVAIPSDQVFCFQLAIFCPNQAAKSAVAIPSDQVFCFQREMNRFEKFRPLLSQSLLIRSSVSNSKSSCPCSVNVAGSQSLLIRSSVSNIQKDRRDRFPAIRSQSLLIRSSVSNGNGIYRKDRKVHGRNPF